LQARFWPVLEAGRCLPHIHAVLPLEKASEAHSLMESGQHSGKILLEVG
jgi:NADPH2:quinone reductase